MEENNGGRTSKIENRNAVQKVKRPDSKNKS